MPELAGLLGERGDQMRMAVAERVDRDAAGEIEIALAVGGDQPAPSPVSKDRGARANVSKSAVLLISRFLRNLPNAARRPRPECADGPPNQKAAHGAAFASVISVFSTAKSTQGGRMQAAQAADSAGVSDRMHGKLGKTPKTDSAHGEDSCHGVKG